MCDVVVVGPFKGWVHMQVAGLVWDAKFWASGLGQLEDYCVTATKLEITTATTTSN